MTGGQSLVKGIRRGAPLRISSERFAPIGERQSYLVRRIFLYEMDALTASSRGFCCLRWRAGRAQNRGSQQA